MGDNISLIRFHWGWTLTGENSKDTGLPIYKNVLKITKSRPPTTESTNNASPDDIHNPDYREAYEKFEREDKGRNAAPEDGYPLVFWPAIGPAEMMTCFDHGIYTVEQLALLSANRTVKAPPPIIEIAKRAARMVELAKKQGKYESLIADLEARVVALSEDTSSMRATIDAQRTQIEMLRDRMLRVA